MEQLYMYNVGTDTLGAQIVATDEEAAKQKFKDQYGETLEPTFCVRTR